MHLMSVCLCTCSNGRLWQSAWEQSVMELDSLMYNPSLTAIDHKLIVSARHCTVYCEDRSASMPARVLGESFCPMPSIHSIVTDSRGRASNNPVQHFRALVPQVVALHPLYGWVGALQRDQMLHHPQWQIFLHIVARHTLMA